MIEASQFLADRDEVLARVIDEVGILPPLKTPDNRFQGLARIIVGQQLSAKAARTIWGRVEENISAWEPDLYLDSSPSLLTEAGVSRQKERFIRGIADSLVAGQLDLDSICSIADGKAREELLSIKGVGEWTCEMFMIFALGKTDIFSMGDAGLRRAICNLYKVTHEEYEAQACGLVSRWSPHRSLASRYLWAWLDR